MPLYQITLSGPQEDALQLMLEQCRIEEGNQGLTEHILLDRMVAKALRDAERAIEATLQQLDSIAKKLPKPVRDAMTQGLTPQQLARLRHLTAP